MFWLLLKDLTTSVTLIVKSVTSLILDEATLAELKSVVKNEIDLSKEMTLDYVEIVNSKSLEPIKSKPPHDMAHILIAVYLGNVRLIDNLPLND